MGLDAVVYQSKANLEAQFPRITFDADGHTEEAMAVDGTEVSIRPEDYIAASVRFGNVVQIGYLRCEVAKVWGVTPSWTRFFIQAPILVIELKSISFPG